MKAITFPSTLFLAAITFISFAGQPGPPKSHNPLLRKKPFFYDKNITRGFAYVPLNETDSSYNNNTHSWSYYQDVTCQYYTVNCLDSVITYSQNGIPQTRILLLPYINGYSTGSINQDWDGTQWDNAYEELISPQGKCDKYYSDIYLVWNGAWDTVQVEVEKVTFNSNGNPSKVIDSTSSYGAYQVNWVMYYNYDIFDTLRGIHEIDYSSPGVIEDMVIDTNIKWKGTFATPSFYCNLVSPDYNGNIPISYIELLEFDSTTLAYQKAGELYMSPTRSYEIDWAWINNKYDTVTTELTLYDYRDNQVEELDKSLDTLNKLAISDIELNYYTYGSNGGMTRNESLGYSCSPNGDSVYPCGVALYSNFTACATPAGIEEVPAISENILVYPNPASDNFTIVLPSQVMDARVEIFNSTGQKIKSINSLSDNKLSISTSGFSAGVYYVRVVTGTINNTAKIVIE